MFHGYRIPSPDDSSFAHPLPQNTTPAEWNKFLHDTPDLATQAYHKRGDVLVEVRIPLDVDLAFVKRTLRDYQRQFHVDKNHGGHTVVPADRFVHITEWSWFARSPVTWVGKGVRLMELRNAKGPAPHRMVINNKGNPRSRSPLPRRTAFLNIAHYNVAADISLLWNYVRRIGLVIIFSDLPFARGGTFCAGVLLLPLLSAEFRRIGTDMLVLDVCSSRSLAYAATIGAAILVTAFHVVSRKTA